MSMQKFLFTALVSLFTLIYYDASANAIVDELDLIHSLKDEKIIDHWQYNEYKSKLLTQVKHSKETRDLGGTSIINGHVQDTMGNPVEGLRIEIYEIVGNNQNYLLTTNTDPLGDYSLGTLNAGTYVVYAADYPDDYIDLLWETTAPINCNLYGCEVPLGSHINLASASIINSIDFVVEMGGTIAGNITDASSLNGVTTFTAKLANNDTNNIYRFVAQMNESGDGSYIIRGIPDGDYRLYLEPDSNSPTPNLHIPAIYGGPQCNGCSRMVYDGIGSLLTISSANALTAIDFSVSLGASISGNIVDNDTLNPLMEIGLIMVFNELNINLAYTIVYGTNYDAAADGSYFLGGLLAGSYYVQGGDLGREFYRRELYNNRECYYAGCNRGDGDPVVLSALENRVGINFLLNKGGKISGSVTDNLNVPIVPVDGSSNYVEFYNNLEQVVGSARIKSDGSYIAARAMPAGSYAARTGSMFFGNLIAPYINEKYNDIPCAGLSCDLTTADITVSTSTTTANIDFALDQGLSFSGTITDLSSGNPIPNVYVLVYKDMGAGTVKFANWATTSDGSAGNPPAGSFEVSGLEAGTYYARTNNGSNLPFFGLTPPPPSAWIDILYSNIACPGVCDVSAGTPIVLSTVRGTNPIIDFSLPQGATIAGKITNFSNNASIPEITVNIYDAQGVFVSSTQSDNQGNYISKGLEAGSYYLTTSSFDVLVDVKYGDQPCLSSCNPLEAIPVVLTELENKTAINFTLKSDFVYGGGFE